MESLRPLAPPWSHLIRANDGAVRSALIAAGAYENGIVLVDDQFAPLAPKIEAALAGISGKPVRFVLNTHFHGDHTGGNQIFGLKATIIAQDNVRKRIAADDRFDGTPGKHAPKEALPIITFDHAVSVHLNGEEIRRIHFPAGHTDGDTIILFMGSKVVHMGDDFFNGTFPFIDLASGGSLKGYIAAVEGVLPKIPDDAKVIPGHGPLGTKADLEAFLAMLKETSAIVEKEIGEGKSLEQLQKENVLAAYDASGAPAS